MIDGNRNMSVEGLIWGGLAAGYIYNGDVLLAVAILSTAFLGIWKLEESEVATA